MAHPEHHTRGVHPHMNNEEDDGQLKDLLEETRILLPGAELLAAFLTTLPFQERFSQLQTAERVVFVIAFLLDLVAITCFLTPAAYHRVAQPIRNKNRFKQFANKFILAGLVPFTVAMALVTFLVAAVVVSQPFGIVAGSVILLLELVMWWLVPYMRAHDKSSSTNA